jgi:hypothetical protein
VATAQARTTPPAYRLRPRGSRSRTPSTGLIPTLIGPETIARMNNWRRTSKQSGHPFRNRQQPGQSRLMGRRSSLLLVVTCGTLSGVAGLRGEGTSYQSLQPTNCQLRAPCETVEFPGRLPTCAGPTTVFGPCSSTRTDCGGFGTTPSTLTPVNRFWRCTRPRMVPRIWGAACTSYDHRLCFPV